MSFEVLPSTEALSTLAAVVRLLTRVDPFVFFQVSRLTEAPSTLDAAVRLLSCVAALVDSQVPHPAERLSTDHAQVEAVSPEVLHPDLSAVQTGPGVLC